MKIFSNEEITPFGRENAKAKLLHLCRATRFAMTFFLFLIFKTSLRTSRFGFVKQSPSNAVDCFATVDYSLLL
jgi:hypothetical protein